MLILTISGSTRRASTNSQLLRHLGRVAPDGMEFVECRSISNLPIFNQDQENENTPELVEKFCGEIRAASGIVVSSPEYVHAIPGGLKNAIDWLVSREEIIRKPIALAHASHRGDEALEQLRRILSTVSEQFFEDIFFRMPIASKTSHEIDDLLRLSETVVLMDDFISKLRARIESS